MNIFFLFDIKIMQPFQTPKPEFPKIYEEAIRILEKQGHVVEALDRKVKDLSQFLREGHLDKYEVIVRSSQFEHGWFVGRYGGIREFFEFGNLMEIYLLCHNKKCLMIVPDDTFGVPMVGWSMRSISSFIRSPKNPWDLVIAVNQLVHRNITPIESTEESGK